MVEWTRARSSISVAASTPGTSTSSAPTLTGSSYISPTNAAFRFGGSAVVVTGSAGAGGAVAGRPRQSETNGPMPLVVEWVFDGASIEINHASLNIQLWVDDELGFASGRGFIQTGYVGEWRRFDFADARSRKLRILMQGSYFGGLRIPAGTTVTSPTARRNRRLIVMGDSYSVGANATPWGSGFAHRLRALLDCDLWPSAVGGTGYLSNYAADPGNFRFRDRLATDVFPYAPDAFLVLGGLNDRSAISSAYTNAAFEAEVTAFYEAVATNLPDCRVVVGSIWSHPDTNADTETSQRRSVLKAVALAHGWPYIDMIEGATYGRTGDVLTSASGPWFPDATFIDTDGVHPTNAGHDQLATRFLAELEKALGAYPDTIIPPPVNTSAPVISGATVVGSTLVRVAGAWTGATSITGQWLRNGGAISGSIGASILEGFADVGATLSYRETAVNAGGSAAAVSNGLGPIQPPPVLPADPQPAASAAATPAPLKATTIAPRYPARAYLGAAQALMPQGAVWPREPEAVQTRFLTGLVQSVARLDGAAMSLLVDAFPGATRALLPEWEASVSLPGVAGYGPSPQRRRAALLQRLAGIQGPSYVAYQGAASAFGLTAAIDVYAEFRVGQSRIGQSLATPAWRNVVTVRLTPGADPADPWDYAAAREALATLAPAHLRLLVLTP